MTEEIGEGSESDESDDDLNDDDDCNGSRNTEESNGEPTIFIELEVDAVESDRVLERTKQ